MGLFCSVLLIAHSWLFVASKQYIVDSGVLLQRNNFQRCFVALTIGQVIRMEFEKEVHYVENQSS